MQAYAVACCAVLCCCRRKAKELNVHPALAGMRRVSHKVSAVIAAAEVISTRSATYGMVRLLSTGTQQQSRLQAL